MKVAKKMLVSMLCLAMVITSLAVSNQTVQAKTYGPEDFGLGFDVGECVSIKFTKITKQYVLYKKVRFDWDDEMEHVSNKTYKKRYSKNVKMYTLKNGYPSTWKLMCKGFTYQNLQRKRTENGHKKAKDALWIVRGNNMLQFYTP